MISQKTKIPVVFYFHLKSEVTEKEKKKGRKM